MFILRDRSVRFSLLDNYPGSSTKTVPSDLVSILGNLERYANQLLQPSSSKILTLSHVNSLKFNFSADVAVEPGITVAIIQPWYIKPAEITIEGASYIGSVPLMTRSDKDLEDLYAMYLGSQGEFGSSTNKGNRKIFQLEIVNNPKDTNLFYGYIRSVDFTESIEKPFMFNYTIQFVGKPGTSHVSGQANQLARLDMKGTK